MLKWLNKIDLLILLAIMALMIFAVLMLYGFNNNKFDFLKNTDKGQITSKETKIIRTDYTGVARKTLDWIDKQRNEEGWYILERGCDYEKKTCDIVWDNKEGNKDGLIATWARLNFYEQYKDPKDLEIVKKDIDIFYDKYKNDNLKDSLWICKITYEMAQSQHLDQIQKDKLEKICFNIKNNTPVNESYQEWFKSKFNKLDNNVLVWKSWDGYNLAIRGVDNYFCLASDFLYKYRWKSNKSDLEMAIKLLGLGKKDLKDQKNANAENLCLLGISNIEMYEYGEKNGENLNYAKDIFLNLINNEEDRKKYQTTICGLLSKKLYQITKDKIFLKGLENNNRLLTDNLLDGETSYSKIILDYGFFKTMNGGFDVPYKNIVENGLIVDLLKD